MLSDKARAFKHAHAVLTIGWVVALPIAIFVGWIESVAFVSACSIYANAVGHASAWQASRAEVNGESNPSDAGSSSDPSAADEDSMLKTCLCCRSWPSNPSDAPAPIKTSYPPATSSHTRVKSDPGVALRFIRYMP